MIMKRIGLLIVLGVGVSLSALAQGNEPPMYNPNSVTPIAEYEQLYRKRVWRRMDLKEKQNQSFFAHSKELTKLIIEAVDRGEIFPYTNNDSLNVRMSKEEFFERLQLEDLGGEDDPFGDLGSEEPSGGDDWGDSGGDDWGDSGSDDGWGDSGSAEGGQASSGSEEPAGSRFDDYYLPTDVSVIEIMEDIIFDKRRARLYYDIQSFKLILPAELKTTGLLTEVATFRYKDLEDLFRNHPEEAVWFNPQNNAEHKNFADAFSLRLHSSRITKIQNTNNLAIVDIYNQNEMRALIASQQLEFELMEKEHDLWEQ
ncbi:MAG: gliding motility protein GldN [Bacteroidota bacterium]